MPITLRIGIAAGKPVSDRGDLFGAAVQLAARLCSSASPGGIVVSVAVRELCAGERVRFKDLGRLDLKGFSAATSGLRGDLAVTASNLHHKSASADDDESVDA